MAEGLSSVPFLLHRRQFLICKGDAQFGADWKSLALPSGYYLHYQQDIEIVGKLIGGVNVYILGQCYTALTIERRTFDNEKDDWLNWCLNNSAGRFTIIAWPEIYTDCGALLGLYYFTSTDGTVCSSSPAILSTKYGVEARDCDIEWGGFNWYPLPGSPLSGVRKLFPDQVLDLETGKVARSRFKRFSPIDIGMACERLALGLQTVLKNAVARHDKVYVALTAGLDSRILFGALLESGARFGAITQYFAGVERRDIEIAQLICARFGVEHRVINVEKSHPEYAEIWRQHTLASYRDADDAHHFPGNTYRFLGRHDLLVRGGCFEIGRHYFAKKLKAASREGFATGVGVLESFQGTKMRRMKPGLRGFVQELDQWLAWRRANDLSLDLIDAFYFDQRIAGWLSAVEQALDSMTGTSLHPVNCVALFSSLLSGDSGLRERAEVQRLAIKSLNPQLIRFPINPDPLHRKVVRRARKLVSRLVRA
jgi:hypothetical protein